MKSVLLHFFLASIPLLLNPACSNFRGTGKFPVCNEMHSNSGELQKLVQDIERLEKKRIELSQNPELNFEKIKVNEALLTQKKIREEALHKSNQRAAEDCRPMFDDPARSRAKQNDY